MKKKLLVSALITCCLFLTGCDLWTLIDFGSSDTSESGSEEVIHVTGVSISPNSYTMEVDESILLTKRIAPAAATNKEVTWSSSNESILTVNQDGVVNALATGSAVITATSNDNSAKYGNCSITVVSEKSLDTAFKKADPKYTYYSLDSQNSVENQGEQKVLVIPTYFTDDKVKATEANRQLIERSFFGENEECGWRSFAGYYRQASYGKLRYSGHVAKKWFPCSYNKQSVLDYDEASQEIAAAGLEWFQNKYPTFDLSDYDSNDDDYIDSLYIIYASDYVIDGDKTTNLWGYRWSISGYISQTKLYKGRAFSWFSLKFLTNINSYGGVPEGGVNTRIIIHEHGHMLGLADYYDTSYSGIDLVGSFDMQSNNVFDWNAFSKYAVGWTNPYYIDESVLRSKGSASITIFPSALNGDCILVRNSEWNGSPFDEYLLLELFNPELGNNEYDYYYGQLSHIRSTGFGVKIYHVDARLLKKSGMYLTPTDIVTSADGSCFVALDNSLIGSDHHNDSGYSDWENYYLLHMLQKGNINTFGNSNSSSRDYWIQSDTWQTGDTFAIGNHTGYTDYGPNFFHNTNKFDDETDLPYGIIFDSVTKDSATITFTYLG